MDFKNIMIVSFFTRDKKYMDFAEALKKGLDIFNVNYYLEGVRSTGSYHQNCLYKTTFIKNCLLNFKCPVLFIDVDSIIVDNPYKHLDNIINTEFDIGVVRTPTSKHKYTDAIHLWNNTHATFKVLDKWEELNKTTGKMDHVNLLNSFSSVKYSARLVNINEHIRHWFIGVFSKCDRKIIFRPYGSITPDLFRF